MINKLTSQDIDYVMRAHSEHPKKPSKAFRKNDGITPYFYHPIWCATCIATENLLNKELKDKGAQVLLYHDVLEDTILPIPQWITDEVKQDIIHMTFENSEHEMKEIWEKPSHIKLFKLYDKLHNLLESDYMLKEKREKYEQYAKKLLEFVEKEYGELNIVKLARGIIGGK